MHIMCMKKKNKPSWQAIQSSTHTLSIATVCYNCLEYVVDHFNKLVLDGAAFKQDVLIKHC